MVVSPIALKRKTQILLTADRALPDQASACLFGCLSRHPPCPSKPHTCPRGAPGHQAFVRQAFAEPRASTGPRAPSQCECLCGTESFSVSRFALLLSLKAPVLAFLALIQSVISVCIWVVCIYSLFPH